MNDHETVLDAIDASLREALARAPECDKGPDRPPPIPPVESIGASERLQACLGRAEAAAREAEAPIAEALAAGEALLQRLRRLCR